MTWAKLIKSIFGILVIEWEKYCESKRQAKSRTDREAIDDDPVGFLNSRYGVHHEETKADSSDP